MNKRASFSWLYIPLSILTFLAFILFIERRGISYDITSKPTEFLPPQTDAINPSEMAAETKGTNCLILTYSESSFKNKSLITVQAALDSMKIPYDLLDISTTSRIDFSKYETAIITFVEFSEITDHPERIMQWVNNGGKLLFSMRPDNNKALNVISDDLGIAALGHGYWSSSEMVFRTELIPGTAGIIFGESFLKHTSLPVELMEDTTVHIISTDTKRVPILWERNVGDGRIVMINSDQFIDKSSRGLIGAAYSLLQDIVIFPVINAATFNIDDFPAPVPEGKDPSIFSQFTRDIRSFYLNVWLPDIQELKEKYDLAISAFMIESYDYKIEPPFFYNIDQEDLFAYFGGIVLRDGGEIGLHGYNHIPFCMEEDNKNQALNYPVWNSNDDMQAALTELESFASSMLDGQSFYAYVPPSNILCSEAREWLPEILPDLRVIASVYLPDAEVPAYVQEFGEADDGIIEYPRITAGYQPDNYMYWAQANEIWLHYTSGHFIHPDDVLDSYRNKGESWIAMRETLDEYLLWLYSSMPNVRSLTTSEGAMAVQRYARVIPHYQCAINTCQLSLEGFYDEAWLLMNTKMKPVSITNGNISMVSTDLYLIEANSDNLQIGFEE